MIRKPIKEVCTFLPKSKIRAGEGKEIGQYPFFTSSDVQKLYLDDYLHDGERIIIGTGGKPSCNYCFGKFAVSTDNFVLQTKSTLFGKYLYYFLRHNNLSILEKGFRGAGLKHIGKEYLESIMVPVKDLSEQRSVVATLDKINDLIDANKRQLELLDEAVKSRFVEMFGDIFTNEKRYRIGVFNDFVTQMNIGPFGSALKNDYFVSKDDGYCMVYEQKHAIRKNIDVDRRYVDLKKYNELSRFEVGPGDLIVSCRGTIGECHILPNDAPRGIIHPSLMMIKPKGSVNGKFLLHLLERILERQLDNGSGVKMAIQAKELAKVKTIVPDRHLQDEYVLFVEQVDKLKFDLQKHNELLAELLNKKMDEYFGGDM